jgi:hypothetical protein
MGIGTRIFLIHDDDSLERLPLTRFERLLKGDPEERVQQHAGKRVRYAMVALEVEQRKPVAITRIQYAFLHFDAEGRLDISEREREARAAVEMFAPLYEENHRSKVIDARYRFAKKLFINEYKWTPSPEIEAKIVEAIFGDHKR